MTQKIKLNVKEIENIVGGTPQVYWYFGSEDPTEKGTIVVTLDNYQGNIILTYNGSHFYEAACSATNTLLQLSENSHNDIRSQIIIDILNHAVQQGIEVSIQ